MNEFWYNYVKSKYGEKARLCDLDTGSFIVYIKTDDIYKDNAEETRSDTSNYELDRPLPRGKYKKVIGLIKGELGGKVMIEFIELGAKTYRYLIDDGIEDKKAKGTKKCAIKRKLKLLRCNSI